MHKNISTEAARDRRHNRMAAGVAALFAVGGFAVFAAYDQAQMEGIVTDPIFESGPIQDMYDGLRAVVHSVAETVADATA